MKRVSSTTRRSIMCSLHNYANRYGHRLLINRSGYVLAQAQQMHNEGFCTVTLEGGRRSRKVVLFLQGIRC